MPHDPGTPWGADFRGVPWVTPRRGVRVDPADRSSSSEIDGSCGQVVCCDAMRGELDESLTHVDAPSPQSNRVNPLSSGHGWHLGKQGPLDPYSDCPDRGSPGCGA